MPAFELFTANNLDVNYLQLHVLDVNIHVYNWYVNGDSVLEWIWQIKLF